MASIRQSIRSSTASKRPTSAIADGQIALNTASGTPGMFFKDSAGNIIKTGPAHYGASAPNSSPAVGGSTGNSIGEAWLDSSLTPAGWKIWNGSAWVNATPLSSDTVQGLVELATNAETQAGADTARAVTSAGLQSKVSDSISTASSSGIASSSAVKTAYDLANAALPKSGGIITGNLEIGSTGSLTFEGSTADGFETTLAVVDPTLDRTITFPNITGTVVTTGDTGTVTSTMILDGTIVDADINASAEIAVSKLADGAARQLLQTDAAGTGVEWASNIDIPGTLDVTSAATFDSTVAVTGALTKSGNNVVTVGDTGTVTSTMILDGTILNADVNASAAIAGTKISPDFGAQTIVTTGVHSAAAGSAAAPSMTFTGDLNTGIYSPGADQVAISTNGTGRLFVDASGRIALGGATVTDSNLLNIQGSTATHNVGVVLNKTNGTAQVWGIQNSGSLNVFNYTASSTALTIDTSNRLGIGTSSPASTLHVAGTFRSTGQTFLGIGEATTLAYIGDPFTTNTRSIIFNRATGVTDIVNIQGLNAGVGLTDIALQAGGGRVGIGTTSPTNTLHVVSTGNTPSQLQTTGGTACYLYLSNTGGGAYLSSQSNDLAFHTAGSATERARIDSSGRLLVGTSSARANLFNSTASAQFQVEGASTTGRIISVISSSSLGGEPPFIVLGKQNSGAVGGNTAVAVSDSVGVISFQGNDGSEFVETARISAEVDGTPGANDMPGRLVFSTTADGAASPTERMRIRADGASLYHSSASNGIVLGITGSSGTSNRLFSGGHSASSIGVFTETFLVWSNGNVQNTNNSYGAISDVKLKENIVDAGSQWADIKAFRVRKYNLKEGQKHTQIGGIAQEVELISPGLVTESPDRDAEGNDLGTVTKSINYSVLYMKAVKALQEAMERIETLEASNADMLARVTALEAA